MGQFLTVDVSGLVGPGLATAIGNVATDINAGKHKAAIIHVSPNKNVKPDLQQVIAQCRKTCPMLSVFKYNSNAVIYRPNTDVNAHKDKVIAEIQNRGWG